jgi:hypothetical protein
MLSMVCSEVELDYRYLTRVLTVTKRIVAGIALSLALGGAARAQTSHIAPNGHGGYNIETRYGRGYLNPKGNEAPVSRPIPAPMPLAPGFVPLPMPPLGTLPPFAIPQLPVVR